jgi:hypothetical protein
VKKVKYKICLILLIGIAIYCSINFNKWRAEAIAKSAIKDRIKNYTEFKIESARKKEDGWHVYFRKKGNYALGAYFTVVVNDSNNVEIYPGE